MPTLNLSDGPVDLDDEGCLLSFDRWNPDVARALAEREGIPDFGEAHMNVLHAIRKYYGEFKVAPMLHILTRECGLTYRELHGLFSKQPGKRAARLAGLPKTTGCV